MTTYKAIIWVIVFGFLSIKSFTQNTRISDSIIHSIEKISDYNQKINALHETINKINLSKFDETLELAKYGYALADNQNDNINKGDFLRIIGATLNKKGYIDSSSVYYFKALEILEPTENTEKLGLLYDQIARMYRKLNQPKRALEFYDKALDLYEKENNQEGIARINNESGVVFRDELSDYKTANERFEKSLRIQQERNDSVGMGYALEFLGYNQMRLKDYKKAEKYLMQALDIREKIGDEFSTMLNYTALGEYYSETNQYQKSNVWFEKSNDIARKINFIDIQSHNYNKIMNNYEALGDYEKAFQSLKSFTTLNDSLYNTQKLKDVEEITTKYETAEKEKEIAEQELALKNRNQWIFGLTTLAIIIALIGFLLYKQQILKNIQQLKENQLKLALEKIESQNMLQEQRLSISRDLHDNIGAQLSFIVSAIDTIKYYTKEKNESLTTKLNNIGTFAQETIRELRDTIWAMNKSNIQVKDLKLRVANFIEKIKQSSHNNIQVSVTTDNNISEDTTFTGMQGLNIFRIIQEATNNALKYAEADKIDIHISQSEDAFHFLIQDNGKGFHINDIELGNGIQNMKKRALELGHELELQSEIHVGTRVSFSLSVKN